MSNEPNAVEQAVVRALRDNLERMQRNSDELHHAVADVVAACSSNKPTNALPPLLRAQTSAASLTAALEVLSRFIAVTLQTGARSPLEAEISRLTSAIAVEAPAASPVPVRPVVGVPEPKASAPAFSEAVAPAPIPEPAGMPEVETGPDAFDVNRLTTEEQELHRRANRVAKVSMQDIKMLRPDQVRLGRENKDICIRLKDDIEKAHREYDRRFKPIMDHPVDYFYRWMVEILAEGDPAALGDYPYAATVRH
ncbi:MAG TPA: hypothetical protein VFN20_11725 [Candidatus Acidoferrum sp.]|nr:hypothetical protein [Candidatus Acidoferrum sp.]